MGIPESGYWKPIIEASWDDFQKWVKKKGYMAVDIQTGNTSQDQI